MLAAAVLAAAAARGYGGEVEVEAEQESDSEEESEMEEEAVDLEPAPAGDPSPVPCRTLKGVDAGLTEIEGRDPLRHRRSRASPLRRPHDRSSCACGRLCPE